MSDANTIRKGVQTAYARAVESKRRDTSNQAATGCGPTCGCGIPVADNAPAHKGVAVQTAGYTSDDLTDLPADAVSNAFGCGNPLAFTDVKPGQTVLDLGSGAGIDLLIAARKVGPNGRVIGVDMTDAMIEHAQRNIAASGLENIEVRKGVIEELPVDDASVDWVISNCVINLSPEKERVFAEIARVLRPSGRVSVSDIVAEAMPDDLRNDPRVYNSCFGGAINEASYLQGMRDAGLTNVEVTDRVVYSEAQLRGILESELPDDADGAEANGGGGCCGSGMDADLAARFVEALAGKCWSARIVAQKQA